MNKTVNINLAGIFFHIDEDAYLKLQHYLNAIKQSFTDSQGRAEILADIEARIAEIFSEKLINERQVIRLVEVDEVINIMGQPEDYLVDDEIFEDTPNANTKGINKPNKKLFRDTENSYIGGVSSGLAHYFGIDAVWIRFIWLLLLFGFGTGLLLYIVLWILVPEAKTTAEKLMMTGEPVTINNIEKKIKDGFDTVSETVGDVAKNVSESVSNAAKKVDTNKIKSGTKSIFNSLANAVMFIFKVVAKFIGVILIFIAATSLIGLIVVLVSIIVGNSIRIPGLDYVELANSGLTPIWLAAIFVFFAIGIPFFFMFYLGLKILISNLKSIGSIAKFSLLGLWIISLIALLYIGISEASGHAYNERIIDKKQLNIATNDTLNIKMFSNDLYKPLNGKTFKIGYNENNKKVIYSSYMSLYIASSKDSLITVKIAKSADGNTYENAINRAKNIHYNYTLENNTLLLDAHLTTAPENKYLAQGVAIYITIPEGTVIKLDRNTKSLLNRYSNKNIVSPSHVNHYITIDEEKILCNLCEKNNLQKSSIKTHKLDIENNGININTNSKTLTINDNGINAESEEIKVKIDSNGISIKAKNNL